MRRTTLRGWQSREFAPRAYGGMGCCCSSVGYPRHNRAACRRAEPALLPGTGPHPGPEVPAGLRADHSDLADHGEPAEYEAARELLTSLDIPVHVIPGNHDNPEVMVQVLAGTRYVRAAAEGGRCYPAAGSRPVRARAPAGDHHVRGQPADLRAEHLPAGLPRPAAPPARCLRRRTSRIPAAPPQRRCHSDTPGAGAVSSPPRVGSVIMLGSLVVDSRADSRVRVLRRLASRLR